MPSLTIQIENGDPIVRQVENVERAIEGIYNEGIFLDDAWLPSHRIVEVKWKDDDEA